MVVGECGELPAEVGDVGGAPARRTAPNVVEQRRVADHGARDLCDPECAEPTDQLNGGRSVALLPDPVEGAVAERRVAAAPQVQITVPDASGQ